MIIFSALHNLFNLIKCNQLPCTQCNNAFLLLYLNVRFTLIAGLLSGLGDSDICYTLVSFKGAAILFKLFIYYDPLVSKAEVHNTELPGCLNMHTFLKYCRILEIC